MAEVTLPIAERFHSIQGEGHYVGTPMHFIRLAGCSVGKPASTVVRTNVDHADPFPVLPSGKPAWSCGTYDGRLFWCDTDFNKYEDRTIEQLLTDTRERHVCLTGGEPLMHAARLYSEGFFTRFRASSKMVHIETSGTIQFDYSAAGVDPTEVWITVAPKRGVLDSMIEDADEIKILVDPKFHPDSLPKGVLEHSRVFLSAVNEVSTVDKVNIERCMFWLQQFPHWRLCVQLHKMLGVQ